MSYVLNTTEEFIKALYRNINVTEPQHLQPAEIVERLSLSVAYLPVRSTRVDNHIFLDIRLSTKEQWQEFGHELCHALWHHDNQFHLTRSYIDYQETQAKKFSYYACVPTCMLMKLDLSNDFQEAIRKISRTFNVTSEFAQKRLELHINKMYQSMY